MSRLVSMARVMGRTSSRACNALLLLGSFVLTLLSTDGSAHAQTVKNRVSFLIDSSGSMLTTPEQVTFPESCVANNWNGCSSSGNPSAAQETCNACMARTIRLSAGCATNFSNACRTAYTTCWRAFQGTNAGCAASLGVTGNVSTRGDGTALTPGCDVDGDGLANDSALYQAKQAVRAVVQGNAAVEHSLWRFAQVEGGRTCAADADCPTTPAGQRGLSCRAVAGTNRCVLDAAALASASGQCDPLSWNGSDATFSCAACGDTTNDYERTVCEAYGLDRIRTGGASPLSGTVNCALPSATHPYAPNQGAGFFNGACDPNGGELLVDFPATASVDNTSALTSWLNHTQPNLSSDVEITANGASPIAAALRDLRASILNAARADTQTPCRRYRAVLVLSGGETCESTAAAAAAAGTFQNMSFTNAAGVAVPDYDVPVYVVALAACAPGQGTCQVLQDLNAIAAAGGTNSAIQAVTPTELEDALTALADLPSTCGCGDGVVGFGEACDDGRASNGSATSCCTSSCTLRPAATVCRPSTGQCDAAETCGGAARCPADAPRPNGTACDDGNACTRVDACQAWACVGASPVACAASDQCHTVGTCNPATGTCSSPLAANGVSCSDGNGCTQLDSCQAGVCVGASPIVCAPRDACHVAGSCNPASGSCSDPIAADGTVCTDGDLCTQTDACLGGTCVGATPRSCGGHGSCALSGLCSCSAGFSGSDCQYSDVATCQGHGAAQNDGSCACVTGFEGPTCEGCAADFYGYPACARCVASECAPAGECQQPPRCDASGACSYADAPTGAACTGGMCLAGACVPNRAEEDSGAGAGSDEDAGVLPLDAGPTISEDASATGSEDAGTSLSGEGTDVETDSEPVADSDAGTASPPARGHGGCSISAPRATGGRSPLALGWAGLLGLVLLRRRRAPPARLKYARCRDELGCAGPYVEKLHPAVLDDDTHKYWR